MNKNIRRFAAVLSLTFILGTTPALAVAREGRDREPNPIVRIMKRLLRAIVITADPVVPIP